MAGGIFTGANPNYVPRELAHQLRDSGAKFLITAEGTLDTAIAAAKELDFPSSNIWLFDDGIAAFEGKAKGAKGYRPWTLLLASPEEGAKFEWEDITDRETQKDRIAVLNYSSGTTGLPKGVMISHYNYVANSCQSVFVMTLPEDFSSWIERARGVAFLPM